ncbi:MAG: hypothetical protein KAR40_14295 [Candidatus Sabulitectum sp.]|nr:hypothetical protein [Candidatus Sabulitectum sp.]
MDEKIDRKAISIGSFKELEKENTQFWAKASAADKFRTITYLRECFYGHEATTGRLQRVYTVFKRS